MKISLPSGFPVLAVFVCALLVAASPISLRAEPADAGVVSDTSTAPSNVTPGTPAFQGLMPPAGSAVIMPIPSTDSATEVKGEAVSAAVKIDPAVPTAVVRYGDVRPDGEDTHPPLNLTPDKAEMVRLETDAGTVIVGSPDNLNVQLENRRLLILSPHQPGATYLSVLDDNGNVLMQRHVIVASPKNNYVRIRRSCSGQSGCQSSTVYYCPGMCHAVSTAAPAASGSAALPSGVGVGSTTSGSFPNVTSAPTAEPTAPIQPAAPTVIGE